MNKTRFNFGVMNRNDLFHRFFAGEINEVEKAAPQKRVGQFFFVIRGNDDDGALLRLNRLTRLVDKKLHAVQFDQQIVRKLDIRLVYLVNQ